MTEAQVFTIGHHDLDQRVVTGGMLNCPSFITFNENVYAKETALNRDEQLTEPKVYREGGDGKCVERV